MKTLDMETLSPFGRLAVQLDHEFSELNRLSGQMERMDIESDTELERAIKILNQFAEHGQNVTNGIQEFNKALLDAREQAEKAAQIVGERVGLVQQRKDEREQMQLKLSHLGEKAKQMTADLSNFSREDKQQLIAQLQALDVQLADLMNEAQSIKAEANEARMKSIERDAQSLYGMLQSARQKIGQTPQVDHSAEEPRSLH